MKRFSEQFHTKSQSVTLQTVEREALKARVISYMEYHPRTVEVKKKTRVVSYPSAAGETFKVVPIPTALILRWSTALSVFLLVVIPALAESTIPGDNLYAVKVRFNEEVRSSLTLDQNAKVEWETKRLNRRIAEARQLANEGRLTPEVEIEVAAAVREHTENVQKEIETLRTSDVDGATLASIELNTTLELQSASLQEEGKATLASAVSDAQTTLPNQLLVDVINETISKQDDTATIPSFEKIMARIEQNTTHSYELLKAIKFEENDSLKSALDRRLQDVNRSVEEAKSLQSQDADAASQTLIATLERTQKLVVFMSDIEVNRAVDLESVVPMILTAQEKDEHVAQLTIEINRRIEVLENIRPRMSSAVEEKVDVAIVAAKQKQTEMLADTTKVSNHDFAKDTLTLLDDALAIVSASGVDVSTVLPTPIDTTATTSNASTTTPSTPVTQ